jgi:Putative transposase
LGQFLQPSFSGEIVRFGAVSDMTASLAMIAGDAAARHDHVDMRVMGHGRAPGVEHGGDADAPAQVLGIGRDRQHASDEALNSRSNRRLIAFDEDGVTFRYKDYRADGRARYKRMTLAPAEFIRRFLIHVLPKGGENGSTLGVRRS